MLAACGTSKSQHAARAQRVKESRSTENILWQAYQDTGVGKEFSNKQQLPKGTGLTLCRVQEEQQLLTARTAGRTMHTVYKQTTAAK